MGVLGLSHALRPVLMVLTAIASAEEGHAFLEGFCFGIDVEAHGLTRVVGCRGYEER
jgi:hypothetical protein